MGSFSDKGRMSRDLGNAFEQNIERSFAGYAHAEIAYLDRMPVPMTPCGRRGAHGEPLYIPKGKAPFDIYGYAPVRVLPWRKEYRFDPKQTTLALPVGGWGNLPVFVGAELKATNERSNSLPIVHPNGDGSGLEYHQLDALALVARMGGFARVVWDNGGDYGILREDKIVAVHATYEHSLATERQGKGKGARGSRSIPWSLFEPIEYANVGGTICLDWLKLEKVEA